MTLNFFIIFCIINLYLLNSCCMSIKCGIPNSELSGRILGGKSVHYLKYQWFALLEKFPVDIFGRINPFCGGALITPRDVLTAAHCLTKDFLLKTLKKIKILSIHYPQYELFIHIGMENVCKPLGTHKYMHRVLRIVIHPYYNYLSTDNDIAIVGLQKSVEYMPICLPNANEILPKLATIMGYGLMNSKSESPCFLNEANILTYDNRTCVNILRSKAPNLTVYRKLCAGLLKGGRDSCKGDSGGPLQTYGQNGLIQIYGIVSFGFGCGIPNTLGFYTDVRNYTLWIKRNTIYTLL